MKRCVKFYIFIPNRITYTDKVFYMYTRILFEISFTFHVITFLNDHGVLGAYI